MRTLCALAPRGKLNRTGTTTKSVKIDAVRQQRTLPVTFAFVVVCYMN
jgi:hypothetical protein